MFIHDHPRLGNLLGWTGFGSAVGSPATEKLFLWIQAQNEGHHSSTSRVAQYARNQLQAGHSPQKQMNFETHQIIYQVRDN